MDYITRYLISPIVNNYQDIERNFEKYICSVLLIFYSLVIFYDIVARFLIAKPTVWGQQVVIGLFIWLAWIATAYAIRHRSHLRFTMFINNYSPRFLYLVYWVEWILWFLFAGSIFWFSIPVTEKYIAADATIVGTSIQEHFLRLSIPVGFGLILIRVAQQMFIITRKFMGGESIAIDSSIGGE